MENENQSINLFARHLLTLPNQGDSEQKQLKQQIDEWLKLVFDKSELPKLAEAVLSNDRAQEIYGMIGLRKLLADLHNPPIQEVIDANLVPKMIEIIKNDKNPHLQLETAWALTNVTSGTTTQAMSIVDQGGIPCFIRLLKSPFPEICEQGVWIIGNLAGDSPSFRDEILKAGALEPLLSLENESHDKQLYNWCVWAISNLCRGGRPLPKFELVKSAIPTLCKILKHQTNIGVLSDAAWALCHLSDNHSSINYDLANEIIPILLKYTDIINQAVSIPCLRTLGNITMVDIYHNLALNLPDYLPKLIQLASCGGSTTIQREAAWNISNITAGDTHQIGAVMNNHHYVDMIIRLATDDRAQIQLEAAQILSNATNHGTHDQVGQMIDLGVLDCLLYLLDSETAKTVQGATQGLLNILNKGSVVGSNGMEIENKFLDLFIDREGERKIRKLKCHPNDDVYEVRLQILEKYFELSDV